MAYAPDPFSACRYGDAIHLVHAVELRVWLVRLGVRLKRWVRDLNSQIPSKSLFQAVMSLYLCQLAREESLCFAGGFSCLPAFDSLNLSLLTQQN